MQNADTHLKLLPVPWILVTSQLQAISPENPSTEDRPRQPEESCQERFHTGLSLLEP